MAAATDTVERRALGRALSGAWLPHGWLHFALQLALFAGLSLLYESTRAVATGAAAEAFDNGRWVIETERSLGAFVETDVQGWAIDAPSQVLWLANWTYFNCQFSITMAFLLFIYIRRNDFWPLARDLVLTSYALGLAGYVLFPTAPPRLFPEWGFVDTLAQTSLNHDSETVSALANPYAAMPSLHTATALLIGWIGVHAMRSWGAKAIWALYPALVVFSIVATGNHFVLDAVAGAVVLGLAVALRTLTRRALARRGLRQAAR